MSRLYNIIQNIIEKVQKKEDISDAEREFNIEITRRIYPKLAIVSSVGFSLGYILGRYFGAR